jgi:probable HAF family extracellular repeat protein
MPIYTYTTLHDPLATGAAATGASGINDSGQVVGTYVHLDTVTDGRQHGFLYAGGTYTMLDHPGAINTNAVGINASGQIVGIYNNGPFHGFLYSAGTYTPLDDLFPQGINAPGQIVGYFGDANGRHGFLYNGGNLTTLDVNDPSARAGSTIANGINASGQIVGWYLDSGGTSHGFLYSGGTYTTLTDPFAVSGDSDHPNGTVASGINDAGQVVGYYYSDRFTLHGFLYSGGIYTTIDHPAATPHSSGTAVTGINNLGQIVGGSPTGGFVATPGPNPPAPAGTSADMILRHGSDGLYETYDIGNNAILAAYSLGQVGTDWGFVTLGGFFGSDTSDMLLRNSNTGGFQVYDITNDITGSAFLGTVGLDWQVMGFGNFSSRGENDMILRNTGTGGVFVYDIRDNAITFTQSIALNYPNLQVAGVSNHGTESDMVLRDPGTGGFTIYDIKTMRSPDPRAWAPSDWIGRCRASAIFPAATKATCCCATSTPAPSSSTTSATTKSRARFSWARSGWSGSTLASARSTRPAPPTWFCATSTPARSRSTTSPTISSPDRRAWARSAWTGSSAASPPIRRPDRAHPSAAPTLQPLNSCKQWPASAAAAARATDQMLASMRTRHSRRF